MTDHNQLKQALANIPQGHLKRVSDFIVEHQQTVLKQCAEKEGTDLHRAQGGYKQLQWVVDLLKGSPPTESKRAVQRKVV